MSDPQIHRIGAPDPVSATPSAPVLIARLVTGAAMLVGAVALRLAYPGGGAVMLIGLFVLGLILILCSFAPERPA